MSKPVGGQDIYFVADSMEGITWRGRQIALITWLLMQMVLHIFGYACVKKDLGVNVRSVKVCEMLCVAWNDSKINFT